MLLRSLLALGARVLGAILQMASGDAARGGKVDGHIFLGILPIHYLGFSLGQSTKPMKHKYACHLLMLRDGEMRHVHSYSVHDEYTLATAW